MHSQDYFVLYAVTESLVWQNYRVEKDDFRRDMHVVADDGDGWIELSVRRVEQR